MGVVDSRTMTKNFANSEVKYRTSKEHMKKKKIATADSFTRLLTVV